MTALNTLLILLTAVCIPGLINRTRAVLAGRRGIRFAQHLFDVRLLLRKGAVYSTTASALFRAVPSVYLGSAIVAALFIPVGELKPLLSFDGDIVCFAYLMALGRFALILGAMDTGSSFEGMGASREALYGALVEPALMLTAGTLALLAGHTSFARIFAEAATGDLQLTVLLVLTAYVLVKIVFTESGRVPVDDPRTHLELTMIHEVMCLDYCGTDLGMIKIAGWLKTAALSMLAADAVTAALCPHWWAAAPLAVLPHRTLGRRGRIDAGPQQTLAQHHIHSHHRGSGGSGFLHGLPAATKHQHPMILPLVILYVITLVYLAITERFRNFASIIGLQGWILFAVALLRLHAINPLELIFIAIETLAFKALLVPAILFAMIRKTKINRVRRSGSSQSGSLLLSLMALAVSASITYYIADSAIDLVFFGVALYALLSGLILIVLRSRIFSHMVGFLVIENGVFLFSMAIGVEMPLLINIAILLDILISVLMLGIFFTKIDGKIHADDADSLTNVKD